MQRDLTRLAHAVFDVAVIGGGIYGISVARDAALRGLKACLLEQGDFGNATSANHHKIVHGGFRYLQHGDLQRVRQSSTERNILMHIAPHLVHPMPCVIPTYGHPLKEKLMFAAALKINDVISFDRNRDLPAEKRIPAGRILSKPECLKLCPDIERRGLTGGALFYDAQVHNADRLNLSMLLSAAKAGAVCINYAEVLGFLREGSAVSGIRVKDRCSGAEFSVRARLVVNCTGPWLDRILEMLGSVPLQKPTKLLKAIVLITRPLVRNVALAVRTKTGYTDHAALVQKGYRFLFITPWRHMSLVGTFQIPHESNPEALNVTDSEIGSFVRDVDEAFPGAHLHKTDVAGVLSGLLPAVDGADSNAEAQPRTQAEIRDHAVEDAVPGLISVAGVKYSTARAIAEKSIDLALKKLGRKFVRCRTAETPVFGGDIDHLDECIQRTEKNGRQWLSAETLRHLLQCYGSEYRSILRYCEQDPGWSRPLSDDFPIIRAEVLHGVRAEMACKLRDVVFRRTELGTAGYPGDACLYTCAEIMRAELGWNKETMLMELDDVQQAFSRWRQPSPCSLTI